MTHICVLGFMNGEITLSIFNLGMTGPAGPPGPAGPQGPEGNLLSGKRKTRSV